MSTSTPTTQTEISCGFLQSLQGNYDMTAAFHRLSNKLFPVNLLFRAIECVLKSWQRYERNHPFNNHQLFDLGDVRCKVMYNTATKVPPGVIWKTQASTERPILFPKFNKYDRNSPVSSDKGLFLCHLIPILSHLTARHFPSQKRH